MRRKWAPNTLCKNVCFNDDAISLICSIFFRFGFCFFVFFFLVLVFVLLQVSNQQKIWSYSLVLAQFFFLQISSCREFNGIKIYLKPSSSFKSEQSVHYCWIHHILWNFSCCCYSGEPHVEMSACEQPWRGTRVTNPFAPSQASRIHVFIISSQHLPECSKSRGAWISEMGCQTNIEGLILLQLKQKVNAVSIHYTTCCLLSDLKWFSVES